MAGDDAPLGDVGGSRDYPRVLLVAVALLAVLVAATAVPALSPGAGSPAEMLVPDPPGAAQDAAGEVAQGASASGLGALSPGERTSVGGSLGGSEALRSQSAETHFVVQSTTPSYWRTGSYDTYIGEGWERSGESTPVDGAIPVPGERGEEILYEVTLRRDAAAMPTVWQPSNVSRESVVQTDGGAIRPEQTLPAGTTYTGRSYAPPDDPTLLRRAGTDYPDAIEREYTDMPRDSRVRLAGITDEITENASNPYESARAIETWLETNKEYSLNVSQPTGEDVAAQFVFEMDEGYCEYFATSMAAMLRSQDIPARYVVGYSTGQVTGQNTYTVRGMNAHAWVEVYFPDYGWVHFDPTPGQARRAAEEQAYEEQRDGEYETGEQTPTPTPTPTETPVATPNGTVPNATDDNTTDDPRASVGGYDVTLNRSAVPGAAVEVSVVEGDTPVQGATVLFDGESVGVTGPDGTVVGRVPYTESLNITVTGDERSRLAGGGVPPGAASRLYTVTQAGNGSATFDVETRADLSLSGQAVTGADVTVTATVDGVPVRSAAVFVDGQAVTATGDDGRATVTLPDDPGNVTLAVRRDPVAGNRTLSLPELTVSATPTAPLTLPLTGVEVNATMGDAPAPGAPILLNGQRVAETGVDGTAVVSLPLASEATIAVGANEQRATATVGGLYANLAVVAAAVALLLAALALVSRRFGTASVAFGWRRAVELVVSAVLGVGVAIDRALTALVRRALATVAHLRALVGGRRSPADLAAALRAWLVTRGRRLRETALARFGTGEAAGDGAHATLREAWGRFLACTSVTDPGTATPERIAARAIQDDDLPPEAVWAIVDAFREVEYGGRDPDERVPGVERAVEAIEAVVAERADDGATAGATETGDGDDSTATDAAGVAD